MRKLVYFVESHLVWFVIFVAGTGLAFPEFGLFLKPSVGLLLAVVSPNCTN